MAAARKVGRITSGPPPAAGPRGERGPPRAAGGTRARPRIRDAPGPGRRKRARSARCARWAHPGRSPVVDALHQAAVAGDRPGAVLDQVVTEYGVQVTLGDRHAHRHREALAERAGGAFDPGQLEILGMTRAGAAELAEIADVLDRR